MQSGSLSSGLCAGPRSSLEIKPNGNSNGGEGDDADSVSSIVHNNFRREIGVDINRFGTQPKSFPFCLGLELHLEMLQGTKLTALGYLATGASSGAPRQGWAERGDNLFALRFKSRARSQEVLSHPALAQRAAVVPSGLVLPQHMQHKGAGELQGREFLPEG